MKCVGDFLLTTIVSETEENGNMKRWREKSDPNLKYMESMKCTTLDCDGMMLCVVELNRRCVGISLSLT